MKPYRGRFAPSPSGPLHFGSMVAAVGSYLDAKAHGGNWAVRIDDLDPPRIAPGSIDSILGCLQAFGMQWDDEVVHQSARSDAYRTALTKLRNDGLVYACVCSRKEIEDAGSGTVYPGTCRAGIVHERRAHAWRVRTTSAIIGFDDLLRGQIHQDLEHEVGDFVAFRADGIAAYHLACAVDDAAQGITHVVRGADLLDSTPRQIYMQQLLGVPTPAYLHLPVAAHTDGRKLSKQTLAQAVNPDEAATVLGAVLEFLNHAPPDCAHRGSLDALWGWAIDNWRRERLPDLASIAVRDQNVSGEPS
ncbi:MAG: tRNA glutamyl-Q(34) synthetase GluQRS [Betaproteobacteria bacterium]